MDRKKVVVYGWYGHKNIGDEAFKDVFTRLWPEVDFTFVDNLPKNVNSFHALWVGGGSFIDQEIKRSDTVTIPVGFFGIGCNGYINPKNIPLLQRAKMIVVRDTGSVKCVNDHGAQAELAPDLVLTLPQGEPQPREKVVSIFMNEFLIPRSENDKDWKIHSYEWFCCEFRQVCADLIGRGYTLQFVPMCTANRVDDWTAAITIAQDLPESFIRTEVEAKNASDVKRLIAASSMVISLRLHGAILSLVENTPFICVSHHDKIEAFCSDIGSSAIVYYYGFSKRYFNQALANVESSLSRRSETLGEAKTKWEKLSAIAAKTFSL